MSTAPVEPASATALAGGRRVDLDAARAARREAQGQHVEVTLGGELFLLPVELPLAAMEGLSKLAELEDVADDDDAGQREQLAKVQGLLNESLAELFCDEQERPEDERGNVTGDHLAHAATCAWRRFYKQRPSLDDLFVLWEALFTAYGTTMGEALARIGSAATDGAPSNRASRRTTAKTRGKPGPAKG